LLLRFLSLGVRRTLPIFILSAALPSQIDDFEQWQYGIAGKRFVQAQAARFSVAGKLEVV